MNIIMSIRKQWANKIFDGTKPLEFRKKLPNNISVGDKIFIYETLANGGKGAIIGYFIVKNIKELSHFPYGAYDYIEYYYRYIKKDLKTANIYKNVITEFPKEKYPNYKFGFAIKYALSPLELEDLKKTGDVIDTFKMLGNITTNPKLKKILEDNEKSRKAIIETDNWLESIGYYNDCGECLWKYGIEIGELVKYNTPKPISNFKSQVGETILKAPQSWMYTLTNA